MQHKYDGFLFLFWSFKELERVEGGRGGIIDKSRWEREFVFQNTSFRSSLVSFDRFWVILLNFELILVLLPWQTLNLINIPWIAQKNIGGMKNLVSSWHHGVIFPFTLWRMATSYEFLCRRSKNLGLSILGWRCGCLNCFFFGSPKRKFHHS